MKHSIETDDDVLIAPREQHRDLRRGGQILESPDQIPTGRLNDFDNAGFTVSKSYTSIVARSSWSAPASALAAGRAALWSNCCATFSALPSQPNQEGGA